MSMASIDPERRVNRTAHPSRGPRLCPRHIRELAGLVALAGLLGLPTLCPGAPAPRPSDREPIKIDAKNTEIDGKTQETVLTQVTITQGDLSIRADRAQGKATGANFENSRWVFSGNVHIQALQHGTLLSDEAVVDFHDNQVARAVATGHPAQFEQTSSETGVLARGHANTIDYEVPAATMRLSDEAWLTYGPYEMDGPLIVYNIDEQKLVGSQNDAGNRVHLTIVPQQGAQKKGRP
jgi:lipopolysaccharide transport protein LptA